jgi:hypothetical protein
MLCQVAGRTQLVLLLVLLLQQRHPAVVARLHPRLHLHSLKRQLLPIQRHLA